MDYIQLLKFSITILVIQNYNIDLLYRKLLVILCDIGPVGHMFFILKIKFCSLVNTLGAKTSVKSKKESKNCESTL